MIGLIIAIVFQVLTITGGPSNPDANGNGGNPNGGPSGTTNGATNSNGTNNNGGGTGTWDDGN